MIFASLLAMILLCLQTLVYGYPHSPQSDLALQSYGDYYSPLEFGDNGENMEKRAMMRLGKRAMMRLGKRSEFYAYEKRAPLRLG